MPAAIPAVAAESILAAEVLAAEAAAAAAAEAASVAAAETAAVAAAEAAATAAAEQAATAAATEAATAAGTQAATQAATGIEALSLGQATPVTGTGGLDALAQAQAQAAQAAQAAPVTSSYTGATSPFAGTPAYAATPQVPAAATFQNTVPEMFQNALAGGSDQATADALARAAQQTAPVTPEASTMLDYGMTRPAEMGGASGMTAPLDVSQPIQAPTKYDIVNPTANYNVAGSVPSGASVQTATAEPGFFDQALDYIKNNKISSASLGLNALNLLNKQKGPKEKEKYSGPLSKFKFNPDVYQAYEPEPPTPYQPRTYYAGGGQVEMMSNQNAIGANTGYPMADINKGAYATPYQQPISRNVVDGVSDTGVNPMTGEMTFASGGISNLGSYSDYARGGRMLKGPGDGMSDNIPATIAGKQPARLANEEFVIPADVVSHLGNGSSEAGAKALYKMMDRVRQARTGNKKQGKQINPEKYLA